METPSRGGWIDICWKAAIEAPLLPECDRFRREFGLFETDIRRHTPMKRLFLTSVAFAGMSVAALAADLPMRTVPPAPVFALYNWTGFYVGLHAGVLFADSNGARDALGYNLLGEGVGIGSKT